MGSQEDQSEPPTVSLAVDIAAVDFAKIGPAPPFPLPQVLIIIAGSLTVFVCLLLLVRRNRGKMIRKVEVAMRLRSSGVDQKNTEPAAGVV